MSDIYIVLDRTRVVGASAKLQGAEDIRAEGAAVAASDITCRPDEFDSKWQATYRAAYDRMTIVNAELQDAD